MGKFVMHLVLMCKRLMLHTSPAVNTWTFLRFPTILTSSSCLLNLLCRECILSAIKDGAHTLIQVPYVHFVA